MSTVRAEFSIQAEPFHLSVVLVIVPEAIAVGIAIVDHLVLVPIEVKTWPRVPVAPRASVSRLEILRLLIYEVPDILSLVVEELLRNTLPDTVRLVVEALARVLCPCTLKVPVLVVEAKTLLEDMRLLIVA